MGLPDFTPDSQKLAAVNLLKRRDMLAPLLLENNFSGTIHNGVKEWASFPAWTKKGQSYYKGQPTHTYKELKAFYTAKLKEYSHDKSNGEIV